MQACVLLSGGLDSAICLHLARERFASVMALSIDYGQRHATELTSARQIASQAGVRLIEAKATIPWCSNALIDGVGDVVVPGRNAILASLAAAHVPGGTVVMGCCADDAERFPDCRPEFILALDDVLRLALGARLDAPLVHKTKAETLSLARSVPGAWDAVALTWSCYAPKDAGARRPVKCGECLACEVRARAFAEIGESDPAR